MVVTIIGLFQVLNKIKSFEIYFDCVIYFYYFIVFKSVVINKQFVFCLFIYL